MSTEVPNTFSISLILTREHRAQFTYNALNSREHRTAQQENLGWAEDFHLMEPKGKEIGFHYYGFLKNPLLTKITFGLQQDIFFLK